MAVVQRHVLPQVRPAAERRGAHEAREPGGPEGAVPQGLVEQQHGQGLAAEAAVGLAAGQAIWLVVGGEGVLHVYY